MTSDRPYRDAMPSRVARLRLAQAVETQFDTSVVAAFEAILAAANEDYRVAKVGNSWSPTISALSLSPTWTPRSVSPLRTSGVERRLRLWFARPAFRVCGERAPSSWSPR